MGKNAKRKSSSLSVRTNGRANGLSETETIKRSKKRRGNPRTLRRGRPRKKKRKAIKKPLEKKAKEMNFHDH